MQRILAHSPKFNGLLTLMDLQYIELLLAPTLHPYWLLLADRADPLSGKSSVGYMTKA